MPQPVDDGAGRRHSTPAPCGRAREALDPYLDGDLSAHEVAGLEAHLADCPACRAELALARELATALRAGLPLLACPPEVTAEVLRVAREEAAAGSAHLGERFARWAGGPGSRLAGWLGGAGGLRPALLGAALVLLLVAAPFLYRSLVPGAPGVDPGHAASATEPGTGGPLDDGSGALSPEELAQAEREARLVLAYVAAVGRDAGRSVRDEVFADGIVRPTRAAVADLRAAGAGDRRQP